MSPTKPVLLCDRRHFTIRHTLISFRVSEILRNCKFGRCQYAKRPQKSEQGDSHKNSSKHGKFIMPCLWSRPREKLNACRVWKRRVSTCRKSICEKCVRDIPWEGKVPIETARSQGDNWKCTLCLGVCPDRAQCFVYGRTTA